MDTLLIDSLATSVLWFMLSRVPIYIHLQYLRSKDDDHVTVTVYLLQQLLVYQMTVPIIEMVQDNKIVWPESAIKTAHGDADTNVSREKRFVSKTVFFYLKHPQKFRQLFCEIKWFKRLYQQFMEKIISALVCEKFYWKTTYGSEDAAVTGIMVGALWAIKGMVMAKLKRRLNFRAAPTIKVIPAFKHDIVEIDFKCIFSIRLGNVISAVISTVKINFRRKGATGGGGTSDTRIDEDCNGKHQRNG